MTNLLKKAFEAAAKLSPQEQDALGRQLLEEIESERRWESAFSSTSEGLEKLTDEAMEENRTGKTRPLDPERL
jgi:hypothetical protein